ncbi:MAG: TspO/MBR family protein [Patescibacteria group bacterium]|jgi:benzodiazapine receptor
MARGRRRIDWFRLGVALGLPFVVAAIGGAVTTNSIETWYAGLVKPAFSPPNWLFAPAWTALYFLMGIAFYRVIRGGVRTMNQEAATEFFVLQLGLNLAWSVVFFGFRQPDFALVVILLLLLFIIGTVLCFRSIDRAAALLLVPYFIWVSFATYLNLQIVLLNS